jgi:hypothetical protein
MSHSIQFDHKLMHTLFGDPKLTGKLASTHWTAQCLQEPLGSLPKPFAIATFLVGDGFELTAPSMTCHPPLMVGRLLDEPKPPQRVQCAQGLGEI